MSEQRPEDAERPINPENDATDSEQKVVRPRIWVGSWADYNNGILHGYWIDAARDPDELQADIDAMLAASPIAQQTGMPSEEWGVFDSENFRPLLLGEQPSLDYISTVARGIAQDGPAYAAFAALELGGDFADSYLGHYESVEAYVDEQIDAFGFEAMLDEAVPGYFRPYVRIDVEGIARDLQLGGEIAVEPAVGGGVWIFATNR